MGIKARFVIKEIDRGWRKIANTIGLTKDSYAKVGVIGEDARGIHDGLSNVALAAIHEFGTVDGRVPERSFIRATFEMNRAEYLRLLKLGVKAAYQGKAPIEQTLKLIGLRMENDIKKRIRDGAGIPPPLAQSTIDRKGSSRPLVDTGQLVNSISSVVVINGSEKK